MRKQSVERKFRKFTCNDRTSNDERVNKRTNERTSNIMRHNIKTIEKYSYRQHNTENNKKQLKQHAPHNSRNVCLCACSQAFRPSKNIDQTVIIFRYFHAILLLRHCFVAAAFRLLAKPIRLRLKHCSQLNIGDRVATSNPNQFRLRHV